MDLELSDEQTWLSEAVGTLLDREWRPAPEAPSGTADARDTLWRRLTDFGALAVGADDGLGAVELCVIARALGEHLAPVPYLASAAVRYAVTSSGLPELCGGADAVALAILEPGSGWGAAPRTTLEGAVLSGRKVAVEHLAAAGPDRGRRGGARRAGAGRGRAARGRTERHGAGGVRPHRPDARRRPGGGRGRRG